MITLPSEIATSAGMFVFAIVQALILLALAPLFSGISRMIRARIQSRRGPGVLQDYRDIAKLMKRQNIWPDNAGWVSKVMPYVLISTVMVVAMSLPLFTRVAPFGAGSDLITVIYLFALFRFFFSIAGLDSNSTFSSLGASREVTLGVLVEPILMLAFLVIALIAGSTNFAVIGNALSENTWQYPIEYSGPALALLKIGLSLKSMVVASIFVSVLLPFGIPTEMSLSAVILGGVLFFVKLLVVFVLACVFENTLSRTRFMLTGRLTVVGFGISVLAFVFYFTGL